MRFSKAKVIGLINRVVKVILLVTTVWCIYVGWVIFSYGNVSEPVPSDAAIVLGCRAHKNCPSTVLRHRIDRAIELYKQGVVKHIIFTGGLGGPGRAIESIIARNYAIQHGIPATGILLETQSHDTIHNLLYAKAVAEKNGMKSFIVVSDPFHMKRAILMAHDCGIDAHSCPYPMSKYDLPTKLSRFKYELPAYTAYLIRRPFMHR